MVKENREQGKSAVDAKAGDDKGDSQAEVDLDQIDGSQSGGHDLGRASKSAGTSLDQEESRTCDQQILLNEIKQLKEDKLRVLADFENTRKRLERERDAASKFAINKFASDLLEVYDDMTRALQAFESADVAKDIGDLIDGVRLIMRSLEKLFAKHNIIKIAALGQAFDQTVHQALFTADSSQYPKAKDGEIVEVVKDGFLLNGRLLRSASVGVVRKS